MVSLVSFIAVAVGADFLGLAMSVASKKGTIAAAIVIVVGVVGVAYSFMDRGPSSASNPPDMNSSRNDNVPQR